MAIALSRVRTGRCLRFSTTSRWIKPLVYQVLGEPLQKHHHESGAEQYEGYSCPAPERSPFGETRLTEGVIRGVTTALPVHFGFLSQERFFLFGGQAATIRCLAESHFMYFRRRYDRLPIWTATTP